MLPTNTVNITGLRTWRRGFELHEANRPAPAAQSADQTAVVLLQCVDMVSDSVNRIAGYGYVECVISQTDHLQMFDDRPQRQRGNKRQRTDQQDRAHHHHHKQRRCVGSVPAPGGVYFLRASEPAIASVGIISQ